MWSAEGTAGTGVCSQDDKGPHRGTVFTIMGNKTSAAGIAVRECAAGDLPVNMGRATKPSPACQEWSSGLKPCETGPGIAIWGARLAREAVTRVHSESLLLSPNLSLKGKLKQGCQKHIIPFSQTTVCHLRVQRDIRRWVWQQVTGQHGPWMLL